MIKLTVAIITFNEEEKIQRCIESVKEIADEILLIDSYSTDKTVSIAKDLGARVVAQKFLGYIGQKNFALDSATHDHVLSLDADEALSPELRAEIVKVKKNWRGQGYYFNRLTNYAGHWVKYCGWYPDRKLRLVEKQKARWEGNNPHDILKIKDQSPPVFLKGDLLHYSYDSISDHVQQTNNFTTLNAKSNFDQGVRSNWFKILTRPFLKFLRDYFFKLGLLDGRYGFIICYINALSAFLKYAKIKDLQEGKKITL